MHPAGLGRLGREILQYQRLCCGAKPGHLRVCLLCYSAHHAIAFMQLLLRPPALDVCDGNGWTHTCASACKKLSRA
jgi:hypothetical protein